MNWETKTMTVSPQITLAAGVVSYYLYANASATNMRFESVEMDYDHPA